MRLAGWLSLLYVERAEPVCSVIPGGCRHPSGGRLCFGSKTVEVVSAQKLKAGDRGDSVKCAQKGCFDGVEASVKQLRCVVNITYNFIFLSTCVTKLSIINGI